MELITSKNAFMKWEANLIDQIIKKPYKKIRVDICIVLTLKNVL